MTFLACQCHGHPSSLTRSPVLPEMAEYEAAPTSRPWRRPTPGARAPSPRHHLTLTQLAAAAATPPGKSLRWLSTRRRRGPTSRPWRPPPAGARAQSPRHQIRPRRAAPIRGRAGRHACAVLVPVASRLPVLESGAGPARVEAGRLLAHHDGGYRYAYRSTPPLRLLPVPPGRAAVRHAPRPRRTSTRRRIMMMGRVADGTSRSPPAGLRGPGGRWPYPSAGPRRGH